MKPQVVIARTVALPLIGLSALFVGTHCNNTRPKQLPTSAIRTIDKKPLNEESPNEKILSSGKDMPLDEVPPPPDGNTLSDSTGININVEDAPTPPLKD